MNVSLFSCTNHGDHDVVECSTIYVTMVENLLDTNLNKRIGNSLGLAQGVASC